MNKIIVAEDDLITQTIMKLNLEKLGFQVLLEESGNNMLRLLKEHHPVACFIDIIMEGKEGVETITELNKLSSKPKLIAISENPFYLDLVKLIGADAVLNKPITLEKLQKTLESLGVKAG